MRVLIIIFSFCLAFSASAQDYKRLPGNIKIKDLKGNSVTSGALLNGAQPIVIDFWATWCKPCIVKYNTMKEVISQWQEETGVRLIIVSIDDDTKLPAIKKLAEKYQWPFEMYVDSEKALYQYLEGSSKGTVPLTFFIDPSGTVKERKSGVPIYVEGQPDANIMDALYGENAKIEDLKANLEEYYNYIKALKN